jgi:hypothetical protein
MAEAEGEYVHGSMNIEAQRDTFAVFWTVTKWASVLIGLTLVLLATMRTNAIDCTKAEQAASHINSCGKLPGAAEAAAATDPTISTAPAEAPASETAPAAPATPH